MQHGDFTELAHKYAQYRPGYAPSVLQCFLSLTGKKAEMLHCADAGAGTGIWSRQLAKQGVRVSAVEPNTAMREAEQLQNGDLNIVWNTRHYESNPVLVDIENFLHALIPGMQRVSSGRSQFCETLTDRLHAQSEFSDVLYIEGRHTEKQTSAHYIGLWESVNDVRVQAGEERFQQFIEYIREKTQSIPVIDAEYTTRAWVAQRKD